jgi:ABC-type polar amino acid transport system ATPase subunit
VGDVSAQKIQVAVAPATGAEPIVQLEAIRKSFGDNLVLDGIDLEVAQGEVLVIIGPSGSGKSTLLRCVNLLEKVDSGTIRFEGHEITGKGVDVSAVRQRIGIVFQQFNLFPHLTVQAFEIYGAVMVVFFAISFPLTRLAAYLERRLA